MIPPRSQLAAYIVALALSVLASAVLSEPMSDADYLATDGGRAQLVEVLADELGRAPTDAEIDAAIADVCGGGE